VPSEVINRQERLAQYVTPQVLFKGEGSGLDVESKSILDDRRPSNLCVAIPVWPGFLAGNLFPLRDPLGGTIGTNMQFVRCVDYR
jgi:hypothetical protein